MGDGRLDGSGFEGGRRRSGQGPSGTGRSDVVAEHHLGENGFEEVLLDPAAVGRVGAEHGVVADRIDEPGQAAGDGVNPVNGSRSENGHLLRRGDGQSVADIAFGRFAVERGQVVAAEDALLELTKRSEERRVGKECRL